MEKIKLGPSTHLYPKPTVLVGTMVGGKPNFMTASWCSIACQKPPAISVAINKVRYTLKGIEENGTFSINIPGVDLARKTDYCGIYSGKKRDKSGVFEVDDGVLKSAPLVHECPVNLECRVVHSLELGSHILVVGEVIETHVAKDCLSDEKVDAGKVDPLIFASGTVHYHRLGEPVGRAFHMGKTF